jgi:hypothetical protein
LFTSEAKEATEIFVKVLATVRKVILPAGRLYFHGYVVNIFPGANLTRRLAETWRDVTYLDGCGFGKYWLISFHRRYLATYDAATFILA